MSHTATTQAPRTHTRIKATVRSLAARRRSAQRGSPWLYLEDVTLLLPPLEAAAWRDVALRGGTAVALAPAALQLVQRELAAAAAAGAQVSVVVRSRVHAMMTLIMSRL